MLSEKVKIGSGRLVEKLYLDGKKKHILLISKFYKFCRISIGNLLRRLCNLTVVMLTETVLDHVIHSQTTLILFPNTLSAQNIQHRPYS